MFFGSSFTNKPYRAPSVLHRDDVTAPDTISTAGLTVSAVGVDCGGALNPATAYYYALVFANAYGFTEDVICAGTVTPGGANNGIRISLSGAVPTGATNIWIYVSAAAAPLWVGDCTSAEFVAGGVILAVGGAVGAGGAPNSIDIGVVGTGLATSAAPSSQNTALRPDNAAIISIDCSGRAQAWIDVIATPTSLSAQPAFGFVPFFKNDNGDWTAGTLEQVPLLTALGQQMTKSYLIDVNDADGLKILVASATNVSVDIRVALV